MSNWYLYCKKGDFAAISEEFGISPMLARIIVNRGLKTPEEIRSYLHDGIGSFHDPFLFKDMKKAVDLSLNTVVSGGRIRVIGDYDMDGVCSSIILNKFFEYLGADIDVRLPDRILEGYGMNSAMADDAEADGISLIITCDNGISSFDAVKRAKELGINVIITDHHEPPAVLPDADAIVDAKQKDCPYPYDQLCGAGVCYKFCQAVLEKVRDGGFTFPGGRDLKGLEDLLYELIQFAGMATVADIVPLTGENRLFAKEGIKVLNQTENPGINALISIKGIEKGGIGSYHIGFILSPCVNSAGRLEKAQIAFDLFNTTDHLKAMEIAEKLNVLNEKRKALTVSQSDIAEEMIRNSGYLLDDDHRILVIYLPDAHESVAGIIAGKLKEKYSCPVLIVTESEEGLKGSGRSTDEYNLIEALARHPELFVKFGGHAKAAGFTLKCSPEELSKVLNGEIEAMSVSRDSKTWIDMQLPFRYVNESLVNELKLLEPYGLANDRPLFAGKNIRFRDVRVIGKNSNMLKMIMEDADGSRLEGIWFGHGDGLQASEIKSLVDQDGNDVSFAVLFRANMNEFHNMRYPQAVIEEIRVENR